MVTGYTQSVPMNTETGRITEDYFVRTLFIMARNLLLTRFDELGEVVVVGVNGHLYCGDVEAQKSNCP
jgi:hypothetical protein